MLKNQAVVPEPLPPVSQQRVTPEELAAALATIEERRQAEANRLAGTIPLGQAISELHLDSTSDEIWAEVQAHRAKLAEPPQEQASAFQPFMAFSRTKRQRFWRRLIPVGLLFYGLSYFGILPHSWSGTVPISAPVLLPFSEVPAGVEVYADDIALGQISKGKPLAQISVSENGSGNRWRLRRIGDHVYLRGCIAQTDSIQSLQGKALNVYNDDNSGGLFAEHVSNIELRVDNIPSQKSGGDSEYSEITLPNFQADSFTTLDQ